MKTAKFKDSPLGPIPQDWVVKTIADFGEIITGSTPPRSDLNNWNGDFPWISAQDFEKKYIFDSKEKISDLGKRYCRQLPSNAVLVTCIASIGLNAVVKVPCATNQQINAVICDSDSPEFLYYIMEFSKNRFVKLAGQTAVPIINKGQFSTFVVPCPPLPEQERIAETLGEMDSLIESLDVQIEKKRLVAKGVAHDLLSGKKRLPGFRGTWGYKRFNEVLIRQTSHRHQLSAIEYQETGSFPVIDQGQRSVIAYCDRADLVYRVTEDGAIIFGDHTRIVKYVDFDFVVGADGTQILEAKDASCKYLYFYLQQIDIPNLGYNRHFKFLKNHTYYLPCDIAEQRAIAEMLSEMDAAIAALETKRDKYMRIKEGVMRDLLSGKKRLKGE